MFFNPRFNFGEPEMFIADTVVFQEFAMNETLPLATIQNAVLEFLRGRDDAALFGAQAVNAYVSERRMTEDVDVLSIRADMLAEELRVHLGQRFHIAVRVREIGAGRGYRVFQLQKSGNRHLVDVRPVSSLPKTQRIAEVLVLSPTELIASKVISYHQRQGKPKSWTDRRDLALLLLTFPELKCDPGPVTDSLKAAGADQAVMDVWKELVLQEIKPESEDDKF